MPGTVPAGTNPLPEGWRTAEGAPAVEKHSQMHGRVLGAFENPLAFGAKADGVTDDTDALEDVIAAHESRQTPLLLPPGVYGISRPIDLALNGGRIYGSGTGGLGTPSGTIIKALAGFTGDYMVSVGVDFGHMSDIKLDGNDLVDNGWLVWNASRSHLESLAVGNTNSAGFLFDNVFGSFSGGNNNSLLGTNLQAINNNGMGIKFGRSQDNNAITFISPVCTGNADHGLLYTGGGFVMVGGLMENNEGYGIVLHDPSDGSGATTAVHIYQPWLEGNKGGDGNIDSTDGILMVDGRVSGCFYHKLGLGGIQTVDNEESDNRNFIFYNDTSGNVIQERTGPSATGGGQNIQIKNNGILAGGNNSTRDFTFTMTRGKFTGEVEIDGALNHDGSTVGFYGVTPASRPSAYTQTYSTANKTHANPTATALTDNSGGNANNVVQAVPDPGDAPADADTLREDLVSNVLPALRNNEAEFADEINKLIADVADVKQLANSMIDDLQTLGILQ